MNAKQPHRLLIFLSVLSVTCLTSCDEHEAIRKLPPLVAEFDAWPAPPGARLGSRSAIHKPGRASVAADYVTPLSCEEIERHYGEVLRGRGWALHSVGPSYNWSQRVGDMVVYCRGGVAAQLECNRDRKQLQYTFAVSITWTTNVSPCH